MSRGMPARKLNIRRGAGDVNSHLDSFAPFLWPMKSLDVTLPAGWHLTQRNELHSAKRTAPVDKALKGLTW